MIHQLQLRWNMGSNRGKQDDPKWSDIENTLDLARSTSGEVNLEYDTGATPGRLQFYSEKGNFLLLLGQDAGGDHDVRTLFNKDSPSTQVAILGDYWDARMVCTDFAIVLQACREFFETQDVSHALME